jgi:hypothetical protein
LKTCLHAKGKAAICAADFAHLRHQQRFFQAADLADEFLEIGSSGRIYDKDQIIGQLQQESGEESLRTVRDFTTRELADGLILVTYRIIESRTVRSSIWKRTNSEWRMVFHQGTKFM